MSLTAFCVVHDRGSSRFDNPLICCEAGDQIVLACVSRCALSDYFQVSSDRKK
jgi:hypothetical protein